MTQVDWREMFKNYVRVIRGEEGIDYIDRAADGWAMNDVRSWTDDERAAIDALLAELKDEA